jgi:hypothetical protein
VKALSISQPWADLILEGVKRVENRKWPTKVRGRVLVHAPLSFDNDGLLYIMAVMREQGRTYSAQVDGIGRPPRQRGALLGVVTITDCVRPTETDPADNAWSFGPWCFTLSDAYWLPKPIPYKGRLGFFDVPDAVISDSPSRTGGSE